MSLGVTLRAGLPKGGLLKRLMPPETALADVAQAILAHVRKLGLGDICQVAVNGRELLAVLHPAAPPVSIVAGAGELVCTAQTSAVGPGYPPFLEEVLRSTALSWTADGGRPLPGRDAMHAWLRDTFREVATVDAEQVTISLAPELVPARPGVLSPLGPWSFDWVRRAVAAPPAELALLADEWFPWPRPGRDAAFWSGLARSLAWLEVPWRPPADEDEARVYRGAIMAAMRAKAEDPRMELPFVDELKRMLAARGAEVRPAADGVGFRRGDVIRAVGRDWSVTVPGYFAATPPAADGAMSFVYGDREVHLTPMTHAGMRPFGASDFEALLPRMPRHLPPQPTDERILFQDPPRHGRAVLQRNDRDISWMLHGIVHTAPTLLCAASILYTDATDRPWAESTFRSLRPGPARAT